MEEARKILDQYESMGKFRSSNAYSEYTVLKAIQQAIGERIARNTVTEEEARESANEYASTRHQFLTAEYTLATSAFMACWEWLQSRKATS